MANVIECGVQETVSKPTESVDRPQFDPYMYRVEMPFSALYYPLGFPLHITTNSKEVLEAAHASWERYEQQFAMEPMRLQVGVCDDGSEECPGIVTPRAHQHLMTGIADGGNFFICDLIHGVSFAWVTTAAVQHPLYLRNHILESAALSPIANRYAAPVHAACVAHEGRGVLLCGESGAGKSTLAFACARAGWTYVSDDAAFLVQGRSDRQVLGHCHSARMRPAAAELFAEVRGRPQTPRMRGKPSIHVATSELPGIRAAMHCQVDFVVFLNRGQSGAQDLAPYPRDAARRFFERHLNGWEPLRADQLACVDRILTAAIYELRYCELESAVTRLQRMVREGS
jgi:hypothetical protein